jgi:uncharacterized protein
MMLQNEQDIIRLIEEDEWMMKILKTVKMLDLPDWWVCAGFIRSKIWDTLHGFETRTPLPDVDVIYYNSSNLDEKEEKGFEKQLFDLAPGIGWSVKNQARMHEINGFPPYKSSVDGIAHFPESVTALGAKLDADDKVILTAPYGVSDLINLQVKPSPPFQTDYRISVYRKRVKQKNWKSTWNKLVFHHILDE